MFYGSFITLCNVMFLEYSLEVLEYNMHWQLSWQLHQGLSCVNLKLFSAISDYKIEISEQDIIFSELCFAQKHFQVKCSYILGLDKYLECLKWCEKSPLYCKNKTSW